MNFTDILSTNQTEEKNSGNEGVMTSITPAGFDSLIKVLSLLEKQDSIIINSSKICQVINKGATILSTDLASIVGDGINMHILNPKKAIKLFKAIKGNANVNIIDDESQKRYVVTNGIVKVFLPKQADEVSVDSEPPDMVNFEQIGKNIEITKESRSGISSILTESEYCEIIIHNNQMKGVYIPETAICLFEDYVTDNIDETNADLMLKSYSFLSVDGEQYDMYFGTKESQHYLLTRVNTGYLTMDMYEQLSIVDDESILI